MFPFPAETNPVKLWDNPKELRLNLIIMANTRMILDGEHEELLEMLEEVSSNKTGTGNIFSGVLRIFMNHLKKESETVVPLLGYLKDRLDGVDRGKRIYLSQAGSRFQESYPVMMQEHAEMSNLIRMAQDSVKTKPDKSLPSLPLICFTMLRLRRSSCTRQRLRRQISWEVRMEIPGTK